MSLSIARPTSDPAWPLRDSLSPLAYSLRLLELPPGEDIIHRQLQVSAESHDLLLPFAFLLVPLVVRLEPGEILCNNGNVLSVWLTRAEQSQTSIIFMWYRERLNVIPADIDYFKCHPLLLDTPEK